ncbi:MAG: DNA translocase FtsK [Alphaproteobacteria bacterium]|nr:DNA translocase FtsK [Alphaproteobacteria bacterium]
MSHARALHSEDDGYELRRPSPFARFLTGLLAFSAGVFICGACGSYSPTDPSLNSAVAGEAANLFGRPGALGADLLTQSFGWTAWLMGFALMIGGLRRTLGIGPREPSAWLWGASATILSCCCLAEWPIPQSWPLAAGLGGAIGDVLLAIASMPFAALRAPDAEIWAAAVAGICTVLFAAMAMGLGASDGAALLRAFRARRRAEAEARQQESGGLPAMFSRMPALPNPFKRKQADIIEPIVVTDEDEFEDGDRGFFNAVEKAEGVGGRSIPITPRVLESRPIPESPARETGRVVAPAKAAASGATVPARANASQAATTVAANASTAIPPLDLLDVPPPRRSEVDEARLLDMADRLQGVFNDFKVKGRIVEVRPGPVVTLFELEPAPGVKSSQVISLADDIARSMSATAARVAVIPGRNAIGIELPNPSRETVYLRDLLAAQEFRRTRSALPLALGESIEGQPTIADLGKMPHLLIAGTTGSGKSVGINAMILSLMFKLPPEKCRFIMIDPKMLELSIYEGIPHLLSPVVTDPAKAVLALKWVVREMESRYDLMSKMGVRNIAGFNQKAEDAASKGEYLTRQVQTGWDKETGEAVWENEAIKPEPMPHIVVVIDEVADLMMVAGKDIEACVQRLAQMARAAGIHLIMATQRPSVDVITGTIKANFPTRISYQVTSKIDSRTILGEQGAEQLLGMGDLLWMASGGKITRVHGPFVKDEEVERVVSWLKEQGTPQYVQGVTDEFEDDTSVADAAFGTSSGDPEEDMYRDAVAAVIRDKRPTTSYVQRVLRIGYNRAASMIERMEKEGIITAADHSGKRQLVARDRDHGDAAA